jgi:hypothetical protein
MSTRLLRKIIGLILAALLLTSILLLAGTTAAAQRRNHRRVIRVRRVQPVSTFETARPVQRADAFSTFGPFGRPYHPFWDPYGRHDRSTFYRLGFDRKKHTANPVR